MNLSQKFKSIFKEKAGARSFFRSIIIWGIAVGCFSSSLNNYLADIHGIDGWGRGCVEFFREMPGLLLVFILAFMHRLSDWKIMRAGTLISMAGAALLLLPLNTVAVTFVIMLWSTGEHVVMPVRSAIAIQVARPRKEGASLGFLTSAMNAGTVLGSVIVAVIFWVATDALGMSEGEEIYRFVWVLIFTLLAVSLYCTMTKNAPLTASKKPRLHFHRRYGKFYILELFYGARKQIFLTFAPFLLIIEYGFTTSQIALLMAVCAAVNIFGSPLIGKITDHFGYKNVMIYDTVILFFVCIFYGFADRMFPPQVAVAVLCANYLLDAVISTTSMATNIYLKQIAPSSAELTSTMTSGISINHLISVACALLGGWVWTAYGVEYLFSFAAVMALLNSAFALTLPKPIHAT